MAAITVRELRKEFPGRGRSGAVVGVDSISFDVAAGERLAYIGPNGAGKSTSIKILIGLLFPSAGSAEVLGLVPWKQRRELARHIGTLFGQRSQLWHHLTPMQTYRLLGRIYGLDAPEAERRVAALGDLLDAGHLFNRPVRGLSLGQRMRCELVASLLHGPEILFLDEPSIGLDLLAKNRLRDLVVRINQERRTTVFLTSHDVSDIEQVARRVIVINHGRLIYDDSVARLRRTLLARKRVDVRLAAPVAHVDIPGAEVVKLSGSGLKLEVDTSRHSIREVLDRLLDGHEVEDISVTDPPLEEVVEHIYTRPQ